ncbi:glycosyl transferase group 1 [Desulfotomaculum nigrificans CO-1-SRB]|uniref:Glycosyl transferase group 1 n=1 Tax=Desulfotomaculum nigrificans (strain DSM 14880 / VKM B-2319 / CO-1-SRB) TaxID=868595 RepID=F6B5J5_DESCC|nr:glycosyltransferase family 4 protein [Desulfotomaculum nigrificans]AEF95427.1 glycosyl transferase group 1 [Desulfotomaculum nigrificans CO-1-SRB]
MLTKVCFVYPWATFGGVERILLNRAYAFNLLTKTVEMDIFFLHDSGGIKPFKQAIDAFGLKDVVNIVSTLNSRQYDLISLIDCPEAIHLCRSQKHKLIFECHTAYTENRAYLKRIDHINSIICVPSEAFAKKVAKEIPKLSSRIHVLRNFVPWEINRNINGAPLKIPQWTRTPILFFGRMDTLKDPITLMEAFLILNMRFPGKFMLLFCGPETSEIDMEVQLRQRGIRGLSVILPPIPFSMTNSFLREIAAIGGIFVSPSKGESFGLSAAESIANGLPVILSDIEPHEYLCDGDKSFLFPVGDPLALANRIVWLAQNMSTGYEKVKLFRTKFSTHAFIEDWKALENIFKSRNC